jgi:putative acetyltransferase
MKTSIRPEQPDDADAVRHVHEAAFPTVEEACLVERLRKAGKAVISLVAEREGRVAGHILFSPVSIEADSPVRQGLGLAPVAVLPDSQGRGVGTQLIHAGLAVCRQAGWPYVVVMGEPGYYQRFGFRRASLHQLGNEYGADEPFQVIELQPGSLPVGGGLVKYALEFAELADPEPG